MGKNLRQQRRGRGARYKSPSHRYIGKISYPSKKEEIEGRVVAITHAAGRRMPVVFIDIKGKRLINIAQEGISIGQDISKNNIGTGTILDLGKIPEGSKICNIELHPGDGGKLCRSSGTFATVLAHEKGKSVILMSSKEKKVLSSECRATVGSVASSGRIEKPIRKAGKRFIIARSLGRYYPIVSGVAKNPVDHPFGGSAKPGKHKTISRHMPAGKKVGSISPRRMGKSKR